MVYAYFMFNSDYAPLLIINGPNLNMLGKRDPRMYGATTLDEIEIECAKKAEDNGFLTIFLQSNYEGKLIDWLQESLGKVSGILINPGGLTHTSVSLRDALEMFSIPKIEVHLSDINSREDFRKTSLISGVVDKVIMGLGAEGYYKAIDYLIDNLK